MKQKKRYLSMALAALMLVPSSLTVFAADDPTSDITVTGGTIDPKLTGSITLYKYLDNDGKTIDADGMPYTTLGQTSQDMVGIIREKLGNDSIMPEKNSTFKLLKVADIEQVTENTAGKLNTTGTYYTNIDSDFFDLMNEYLVEDLVASDSTKVTDGRTEDAASNRDDHYESDELNEKMMDVIRMPGTEDRVTGETAINRYVRQHAESDEKEGYCKTFNPTDENGFTSLENLPLGLYLVAEIDWEHKALSKHDTYWEVVDDEIDNDTNSGGITEDAGTNAGGSTSAGVNAGGSTYADIASPASPFLVSVPMTNIADINNADGSLKYSAGSAWMYDITVYPKAGSINIHKDIITNEFTTSDDGTGKQLTSNDGHDTVDTESLCDFVQTNYDRLTTKLDGSEKTGLTHQIDANIGDTITQLISSDVPVLVDDIDNEQTGANHETVERKHNAKYVITDRMTKGLKLIDTSSFKVTMGTGAWNDDVANQLFTLGEDYTVDIAEDKQSFTLTVTEKGLDKMDDITDASYFYVVYDCVLTKDALIGTDTYGDQKQVNKADPTTEGELSSGAASDSLDTVKSETYDSTYTSGANDEGTEVVQHADATNQNTAELTYATDRTQEHDYYSNTTKVFTYEIDLTKLFTDGTQGYVSKNEEGQPSFQYSDVVFKVEGDVVEGSEDAFYNDEDNNGYEDILFWRDDAGRYHVYDPWTHSDLWKTGDASYESQYVAEGDTIDTPEGERQITRYISPSDTGLLTIVGLDDRTYRFTELKTAQGRNLMAEPFYVEIVAPMVEREGKDGKEMVKLENGQVEHAYVWTGDKPEGEALEGVDLANSTEDTQYRLDNGRVPFVVQNNEVIKILRTGGKGTTLMFVGGAFMIGVAAAYVFISRKKKEEDTAEEQ